MQIFITARRMEGGSDHEHIAAVKWEEVGKPQNHGQYTRPEAVAWIRAGGDAYVWDVVRSPRVMVVNATPPYLRTFADGKPTNNLLSLPEF